MIVVTGATGALNGATVDHLLHTTTPDQLAVVARDPRGARRFRDAGIEVRRGDYADPGSLVAAFTGADLLLLVSSSDPAADAVALHTNAVEAARAAGVGHVIYTSHQGAAAQTSFGPGRDHAATETVLAQSGLAWTSLRNGFYAHSLKFLAGDWRTTGTIRVPADGPVSWTSRADLAEAAAEVIHRLATGETGLSGPLTLTAAEAASFADVAQVASRVSGRPVAHELVDRAAWLSDQLAAGRPDAVARFTLGMYDAAAAGWFADTSPLLAELLDRPPATVADVLAAR